jgi:hypothetical protein
MPPQAVTGPNLWFCRAALPPCCFLFVVKKASRDQSTHGRDASKRFGVNKTNSETAVLCCRPSTKSERIFLVEYQCGCAPRNFVAKRVQGFLIVGVARSVGTVLSARDFACCILQKKAIRPADKRPLEERHALGAALQTRTSGTHPDSTNQDAF